MPVTILFLFYKKPGGTPMPNDTIHLLLPVYNRRETTRRFIEFLRQQTFQNYHLVLIDDGSTDGTVSMARESGLPQLTVLRGNGNLWWAGGLHLGYKWLAAQKFPANDIVLINNDDTEFKPDFLATAVSLMAGMRKTLLLAQCFDKHTGKLCEAGIRFDPKRLAFEDLVPTEKTNCLSTRGLFSRMDDFLFIGGFHPVLLPHYLSDYEYTIRAHRKGFSLIAHPDLRLWIDNSKLGFFTYNSDDSYRTFLRKYFSKKSAMMNPLCLSNFMFLTAPAYTWPRHLFVIWKRSIFKLGWNTYNAFRNYTKGLIGKAQR
jgi:GT2 family glycosyltransferase